MLQRISPDWGDVCIVAAPGPSLTADIAARCRGVPTIAVNDAYRLFPDAELLYACDAEWWRHHDGCRDFAGERWSSHGNRVRDNKIDVGSKYGLSLIAGRDGEGFSLDPAVIHYGDNSGFQAINIAGHKIAWRGRIALVGFDMRRVGEKGHFFGKHPQGLRTTRPQTYENWTKRFIAASRMLPEGVEIVNCTPDSALTCFKMMDLADALPTAA